MPASPTPATIPPEAPPAAAPADGLWSRSFVALLATQFLGTVNDNMFRWLVVPIGKDMAGPEGAAMALSFGLGCFVLPYILLAAPAGYLADRFSKRTVIVACKVAELVIMLLGMAAILWGNLYLMFAIVALLGAQSALFGPAKFGSIPELVRGDRISAANGWIGMTTVLAIVLGTVAGNVLYTATVPLGRHQWWLSAAALVGIAVTGCTTSLFLRRLRPANPKQAFPFHLVRQTLGDLALLNTRRSILRAALGSAVFWALAGLAQMNVDLYAITELHLNQASVGVLLGVLALGVGVGSVLAGVWSAGKVELGIVPLGATAIAGSTIMLFAVPHTEGLYSPAFYWACVWLFTLGMGAGLYDVPLQAFLQQRSPNESRGAILAAANFLTFTGMLVASVLFWLCRDVWHFSARQIFLMLGIATLPVLGYIVWLLPGATIRFLVWLLSRTIYRVRVRGLENLPASGGALMVANHVTWIDGVLVLLTCPRPVRMIAYADYVEGWWVRWLARDLGTIPIGPGRKSMVEAIRTARQAVQQGELVCIFPEGGITRDGRTHEFRGGFLTIMKDTDAPVVPVYLGGLWGSIFSFERGRFFWKWPRRWRYPVSFLVGKPLAAASDTDAVRQAVVALGEGNNDDEIESV